MAAAGGGNGGAVWRSRREVGGAGHVEDWRSCDGEHSERDDGSTDSDDSDVTDGYYTDADGVPGVVASTDVAVEDDVDGDPHAPAAAAGAGAGVAVRAGGARCTRAHAHTAAYPVGSRVADLIVIWLGTPAFPGDAVTLVRPELPNAAAVRLLRHIECHPGEPYCCIGAWRPGGRRAGGTALGVILQLRYSDYVPPRGPHATGRATTAVFVAVQLCRVAAPRVCRFGEVATAVVEGEECDRDVAPEDASRSHFHAWAWRRGSVARAAGRAWAALQAVAPGYLRGGREGGASGLRGMPPALPPLPPPTPCAASSVGTSAGCVYIRNADEDDPPPPPPVVASHPAAPTWRVAAASPADLLFAMCRSEVVTMGAGAARVRAATSRNVATNLLAIAAALGRPAPVVACAACGVGVGRVRHALAVGGTNGTPLLVNPAGIHFRLVTLSCLRHRAVFIASFPTRRATWFLGYAWAPLQCASCGAHLGWRYDWLPHGRPSLNALCAANPVVAARSAAEAIAAPPAPVPAGFRLRGTTALLAPGGTEPYNVHMLPRSAALAIAPVAHSPIAYHFALGAAVQPPTPLESLVPPPPPGHPATFFGLSCDAIKVRDLAADDAFVDGDPGGSGGGSGGGGGAASL